jgi:hypothetical protein
MYASIYLGPDFQSLESALKPIEAYALRFNIDVEPYRSIYYSNELATLEDMKQDDSSNWDIELIEKEKEEEEYRILADGELLASNLTIRDANKHKNWYKKERSKRFHSRRIRILRGVGWKLVIDQGDYVFICLWIYLCIYLLVY